MGVGTLEKAPNGLHEPWLGIWRASLRAMQNQGTWNPALRPLLDLYVVALEAAEQARLDGRFSVWDRYARRAMLLADRLALTPRGRRAAGVTACTPIEPPSPFAALDPARRRR
jgi:hypothetical protein